MKGNELTMSLISKRVKQGERFVSNFFEKGYFVQKNDYFLQHEILNDDRWMAIWDYYCKWFQKFMVREFFCFVFCTRQRKKCCFVSTGLFFYSFLSWGVWLHLGWLTCEVNYPHHPSQWTYSLGNWNWFLFQCKVKIFNLHSCAQGANQKIVPRSHFLEINCSNFPPSANSNKVIVDPLTPYMQGKHPPFNPKSLSLLTHNTSTTYTVLLPFAKLFWHEEVNYLLQSLWETWLFGATGIGVGESWALLPSLDFLNFQKLLRCHQPSWTLGLIQNSPQINLELFNTLMTRL